MPTPEALTRGVALVRRRARITLLALGGAWLVIATGGLIVASAILDRAVHLDSPGPRLALLAAIVVATGIICWRYLISPLVFPISDAALAMKIEERFPRFREGLASSLQFLKTGCDPALGSTELQRRAIEETLGLAQTVDLSEAVRATPPRPVLSAAACVLLLAGILVCAAPADALLAAERLFLPFSSGTWPRHTNLHYLSLDFQPVDPAAGTPFKIVRGHKLELLVEDQKGRLPDDVFLEYRLPDESTLREPMRHASLRDPAGGLRDVCLLSLPADRGPVWFRAVGGDDDTLPESEMQVVLPPVVENLEVVLTPPKYTKRPVERLTPGDGKVRGVLGTQVAFRGRSNKPLSAALLKIKDKTAGPIVLLADAREFRGEFVLSEPGAYGYTFHLRDADGIENPEAPRYEIEASADAVPDVAIDQPAADGTVTPVAQLPVTATAKDDLGLRDMRLSFHLGDSSATPDVTIPMASNLQQPLHHRVALLWNLRDLSLSEGMRIVFHAEATDWFNGAPPHIGMSPLRTLIVVSAQQKEAEIASRQADILRLLERAEQVESRTREQTGDLLVQVEKTGRLKPSDLDTLKRVRADQKEVRELLAHPADGAGSLVADLLSEIRQNQLPGGEIQKRLERFQRELSDLRQSHLGSLDDNLTRAVKTSELQRTAPDPSTAREQTKSLSASRHEQGVVLESVRSMLGELSRWRDWQGVHDGLRELVESQEKLNADTSEVSRGTLAKRFSELDRQGQTDLARLAERQLQLADQVARLKSRLHEAASGPKQASSTQADSKQSAESGQSAESEAAADAKSVLKSIERSDPEAAMREIGGDVAQNNVGQAMARQQQLLDELRKLDHRLAQRPESDLKSVVKKMEQAEQQIDALRKDQESLRKATQKLETDKSPQNAKSLETLRKEQSRLREGTEEVTRELRRLGTEDSSAATRQAVSHMAEAEQQLEQAPTPSAQAEQSQAIEQLNQAQAALKRAKREASSQLAQQSAMKVVDEVAGLVARQKTVLDETKRLDAERAQQSNWTRGQLRSLQTVARLERQLQEETGKTAERLAEAEAYSFVLKRATEEIQSAADRLANKLTDPKTVSLENEAYSRLRNIVQALKAESKPSGPQQADSQPNPNAQNPPKPNIESDVPGVAQLQLLKITQQDLLRRTGDLDRQRREQAQEPANAASEQLERLSREQGDLASLIERLASRFFNERDGEHQIESPQRHK